MNAWLESDLDTLRRFFFLVMRIPHLSFLILFLIFCFSEYGEGRRVFESGSVFFSKNNSTSNNKKRPRSIPSIRRGEQNKIWVDNNLAEGIASGRNNSSNFYLVVAGKLDKSFYNKRKTCFLCVSMSNCSTEWRKKVEDSFLRYCKWKR